MMFQEHIVEMLLRHISNAQLSLRADKHILQLLWEGREMARWGDKWEGTPGGHARTSATTGSQARLLTGQ